MAKKLLVREPKTQDGKTIMYDANRQPIFTESIVELAARPNLERMNSKLPSQLHKEFSEIEVPDETPGISNADLKNRLKDLETQDEKNILQARVDELERRLSGKKAPKEVKEGELSLEQMQHNNNQDTAAEPIETIIEEKKNMPKVDEKGNLTSPKKKQ